MIFIGHTKFSVYAPVSGAWKATNGSRFKTQGDYKKYLFSDSRLNPRIDILVNYSLPQLATAAKGHDITHLISYSEFLPHKYEEKLIESQKQYSFLKLEKQNRGSHPITLESVAKEKLLGSGDPLQPFGIFRLDDDDILPADYFDQNSPYIKQEFVGMQVSLGTGVSAIYKDGRFFNARKTYHPMLNIGYTSIHQFSAAGEMTKLPIAGHNVADRTYPVILDSRKLGYLWTRHPSQDTALGLVESDEATLIATLKRHMDRHPPIHDMDELHEAFPVLRNNITNAESPDSTRQELIVVATDLEGKGLRLKPKPVSGKIKLTTTMNCDMSSEVRNSLISFIFVDAQGLRIDPASLDSHFENQPISRSGNPRIGWFRYLSTKQGKNRTVTQFTLPDGVYVGVATIIKWRRQETKIVVTSVSIESMPSTSD
ncbi:glycosyltransferase [Glutamicibacter arilaitensis]|uniref:glycosyltransferase n=1 Tax=Glutamicibacter arilaitensis TaxID=256701 RepID=UPI003850EF7F